MKGNPVNTTAATTTTVAAAVEERPPSLAHVGKNNLGAPSTSRGSSRDTNVDGGAVGKEEEEPVSVVCGDVVAFAAAPLIVIVAVGAPVRNLMASRLSAIMVDGEGWAFGKEKEL